MNTIVTKLKIYDGDDLVSCTEVTNLHPQLTGNFIDFQRNVQTTEGLRKVDTRCEIVSVTTRNVANETPEVTVWIKLENEQPIH